MISRFLFAATLALAISLVHGQETTTPVGYNRVTCLSGSDTLVSVPFMKQPLAFVGRLSITPAAADGEATLTPTGSIAWTAGQFTDPPHYVRFTSGAKAGMWYDVTENSTNSLKIDLNGDTPDGIAPSDQFMVVEHWTLDTLFPPETQTTIDVSSGILPSQQGSLLLFPDYNARGINKPAGRVYLLTTSGGWLQNTAGFPSAGNTVVSPGSTFIVRHKTTGADTTFYPSGMVLMGVDAIPLVTTPESRQDNPLAPLRPVPISLGDANLNSGFESSTGHLPSQQRDLILAFDNGAPKINKVAVSVYYKMGSNWYKDVGAITSNPLANSEEVFQPASGIVLRKYTGSGLTSFWNNTPNY